MTSARIEDALCDASDRAVAVAEHRCQTGRTIVEIISAASRAAKLAAAALRRTGLLVTEASGSVVAERRVLN